MTLSGGSGCAACKKSQGAAIERNTAVGSEANRQTKRAGRRLPKGNETLFSSSCRSKGRSSQEA